MKNNTSFTDEEITNITSMMVNDYSDIRITKRQIMNIAEIVDQYSFNSKKEKILTLEYASRVRGAIKYYIDLMIPINQKEKYYKKYYNTIDYAVSLVKLNINSGTPAELYRIDNNNIREMVNRIMIDLAFRLEKEHKKPISRTLKNDYSNKE